MKTKIFTYKGNLAAETDLINGKFINNPLSPGELGCVIDTAEVEITKEAKELIRKASREGGSFSEIMLTKHANNIDSKSSIGLMGGNKHHFGTSFSIGRDCDLSVLEDCTEVEMEAPQDYKKFIDLLESDGSVIHIEKI